MGFIQPKKLRRDEIFPGVLSRLCTGDNVMLSFVEMQEGSEVPDHAHPEEQAGYMLEGKLRLRIGDDERVIGPGEVYIVPGNVSHSATVVEGPMRVLDIFGPPRDDYRAKIDGA